MQNLCRSGKDQRQHVEMARDIAASFNSSYGETFVLPEAKIEEQVMTIPGTDGQKMSKSYNNIIDIFLPDKELLKQLKSIKTDSTPMEAPKNPEGDTVFSIYSLLGTSEQKETFRKKYLEEILAMAMRSRSFLSSSFRSSLSNAKLLPFT